jgi:hypothetical protein
MSGPDPLPGAAQRTGWGAWLAAVVAVAYYGFLLTGALNPQALACVIRSIVNAESGRS